MKRVLCLVLTLFLLAGTIFAGGKQEGAAAGKVTLDVLAYGDAANVEGQQWISIVEGFMSENPDIEIKYELLYDEAYHQKRTARIAAGDVPDLAYLGADARWGKDWMEAGLLVDHRKWLDPGYYDLSLIPPMGPNGEVWYVPLGTSNITTVLYMNRALVEQLGFSAPKTYEDLVAMVPTARAKGLNVVEIAGADGWVWGSCLMSGVVGRITGDPTWVQKAVKGEKKFTDPEFVASLALLKKMVDDGVISSKCLLVNYGTALSNFNNQKALFMIDGQWRAGGIDPTLAENVELLPIPKLPGEKPNVAGSAAAAISVGYGLTKAGADDPAKREAGLRFLQYFNSPMWVEQRLRDGAIVAPILKNFPLPDDLPTIVKRKVVFAQGVKVITDVIDAHLSGAANDALNAGMQKIVGGQATAEEVAAQVEKLARQ
ncbi:extracellular solute-binding protein family 1 [Spirochaeta thermophila DSM 6578]|uniref:Extracellular solute-binding protein family 1 n=1 Tax=Winmispira thermophila (strain ATCC 700085 / DSM 6578 / Z-1203) TaxID=869211 RepID=G0GDA3_WINT7|nr:extracellular solute-binding protein [Spirochaeta thermophila]AEJ60529.1 extracellular solute-binding protein family 1 [Spirochaeta thermophila DSM 6578]